MRIRNLRGLGLGLALWMALAGMFWAQPASAETAKSAASFLDSIGVNVHLGASGTPYTADFPLVDQRLRELGVRHIRDGLATGAPSEYSELNELAGQGIGSTLILGSPANGISGLDERVGIVKTQLSGVNAVEGPNEYSTSGDPEWKAHLVEYQERLYSDIKDDPALAPLPVLGPSIVHGDQQTLGDVSSFLDFGNIHSYPEGAGPENKVGQFIERAAYNSATKPIMATETGYTNAVNWTPSGPGENKPISEEAAGVYMPRLFFEYWDLNIARTFSYELVDEYSNPALDEREDHFGLLRNDLSEKPAFTSLQNTISILEDPSPAFTPGPLEYTLSAGGATLRQVLLEKGDGSYYLALWRLQSIWNPDTKEALAAPAEPVTVTVPAAFGSYAVYEPAVSSQVLSAGGPAATVTLNVGPGVTILKLTPLPPPPPVAPPPPATCTVPKLKGRSLKASKKKIRAADCKVGKLIKRKGATAKTGKVVHQSRKPGTVVPAGTKIVVTLKGIKARRP